MTDWKSPPSSNQAQPAIPLQEARLPPRKIHEIEHNEAWRGQPEGEGRLVAEQQAEIFMIRGGVKCHKLGKPYPGPPPRMGSPIASMSLHIKSLQDSGRARRQRTPFPFWLKQHIKQGNIPKGSKGGRSDRTWGRQAPARQDYSCYRSQSRREREKQTGHVLAARHWKGR